VDDLRRVLTFIDVRLTEEDRERLERIEAQDSREPPRSPDGTSDQPKRTRVSSTGAVLAEVK
jgi:hypothetical protein